MGNKLHVDLSREGRGHTAPDLVYKVLVVLPAEEERALNEAMKNMPDDTVLAQRIPHIADALYNFDDDDKARYVV